jgi:hypothetical protein
MSVSDTRTAHAGELPAGITVAVGVSGAGKTFGIRQSIYDAVREGRNVVVVDRMREWSEVPSDLWPRTLGVTDVESAKAAMSATAGWLAVLRTRSDIVDVTADACQWAIENGGCVALPEAHRAAPNSKPLRPEIEDLVTAWRHYGARAWLDTQRISLLNRTVTEQASELRIYATVGDNDHKILRELGGRALSDAAREAAARLGRGEPGWHVRLKMNRVGPYELVR